MEKVKRIFISLLSSFALTTSFYNIYDGGLKQYNKALPLGFLIPVFLIFLIINFFFYKKKEKSNKYANLLAIIFTLFLIIGNGFELYGSFFLLFKNYHLLLTIINTFGYYFFLKTLITKLSLKFSKLNSMKLKDNKLTKLFKTKTFWFCFITLIFSWLIYYIAFYPVVLSPDPSFQIKQFLGEKTKYLDYSVLINDKVTITNHHPVIHTILLGSCLKLGRFLINDNFGLFIYTLIQGICLALTLVRTIIFLKKRNVSFKYLFVMLIVYALVPIFPFYAINANKDVYYTIIFINLVLWVFDFLENYQKTRYPWYKLLELFIFSLLLCLFRNNGVFIILPLSIALIFYSKKNLLKLLLVSISTLGIYFSFTNVLLPYLGVTGTSIRESMSIFFQQTAREIKYYEEDISLQDRIYINKVIDYEVAKNDYDPLIADPVKNTYNKYATKKDLKNYLMVWARGFIKHPLVYVDATLNNTYGYVDPEDISWYIYANYDKRVTENNLVNYHYNSLSSLRNVLKTYGALFAYFPLVGLLCNIGIATWLVIAFICFLFKNNKKYLIVLIPYVMSILICFASPVNTYFRYAMPTVFSILLLIGLWLIIGNKKRVKK